MKGVQSRGLSNIREKQQILPVYSRWRAGGWLHISESLCHYASLTLAFMLCSWRRRQCGEIKVMWPGLNYFIFKAASLCFKYNAFPTKWRCWRGRNSVPLLINVCVHTWSREPSLGFVTQGWDSGLFFCFYSKTDFKDEDWCWQMYSTSV